MTTRLLRWGIGMVAAGVGLLAGTMLAGELGLVVVGIGLSGVALIAVRRRLPTDHVTPARRTAPADAINAFPAYRAIRFTLGWASAADSTNRHGRAVRPLLARLAAAVLAHRRHVDPHREPERARALLGPDLWRLVDSHGPAHGKESVADEEVHRLVDRLEEL
jgi:hypothetical protein